VCGCVQEKNKMKKQLLTVVLVLLLLVSWVVIIDIARENKNLSNALKIAEDFLDESREEIDEMSDQIERLMNDLNRGNDWNEEAIPECRR
jgi:peptidoglycan hydrolase CwlO-like protein